MQPEEYYDALVTERGSKKAGDFLSSYWPADAGRPWAAGTWATWRRGRMKLRYEARVALHRAAGLADPPNTVTITLNGDVEVYNYTEDPRVVIIAGTEMASVELRLAASVVAPHATEGGAPVVKIRTRDVKRKPSNRHNLSLYDTQLFSRLREERIALGLSWDEYFKRLRGEH